ncbi:MAG: PcfJ domain-containing protein [Labilithrix sp.]|nr:PcfJ domain-containing protein [Labilithrix sp.]MCW5817117.1 PcfJ domain-containing protein [Labilithrix sp.]
MKSLRHLREARKRVLDAAVRAALRRATRVGPRVVAAFQHLLATVQERTTILSPRSVATDRSRALVDALLAMAVHRWDWRRPVGAWTPPETRSDARVLASLAEHLFASFPVPRFMTAAWLGGHRARREQRWYIRLGAGESVRAIDFPLRPSRRMAHALRGAPDDLSIMAALRWAQVRGLNGSPELARAVAMTRLGRESGDEGFIAHVVAFLVAQGDLDRVLVDRLVEFFHERRSARTSTSLAGTWPPNTDPRADVALCGLGSKTRDRILRGWGGRAVAPRPRSSGLSWKPAPFGGLVWLRADGTDARLRAWRIRELRTSDELREEGLAMRHCVATYAPKCAFGGSSIWSMTVEEHGERLRAVTIEVNRDRREICQVKGPANKPPKKRALEVLRRWVEEQGLTLSRSLARG